MSVALKPCPFCGSAPHLCDIGTYFVTCTSCGIDGPAGELDGLSYAAEAWNTRAAGGKDAERYRWLRRKFAIIGTDCGAVFAAMNLPSATYVAPDAAIELDAAIDAALRGEVKP